MIENAKVVGGGFAFLLSLSLLIVAGCGSGGSPSDVVKAFYRAGNEGDYSKAESYLKTEARMVNRQGGLFAGSFERDMDRATKGGRIERIEIDDEVVYPGGNAGVSYTIYFKDGSRRNSMLGLIKEKGAWKILVFVGQ